MSRTKTKNTWKIISNIRNEDFASAFYFGHRHSCLDGMKELNAAVVLFV
jgi:hypothetical protein